MREARANWAAFIIPALHLVALAVILLLPLVVADYWFFFIFQMVVSAYLALSFALAYSYGKILSFAQGMFFGIGAYATIYLASDAPWGLPLALAGAMLGAAALGAVFGAMLVRMDGHNPTIATVILASAGLLLANALSTYTGGEDGLGMATKAVGIGGLHLAVGPNRTLYYTAAVILVALVLFMWFMRHSKAWMVLRAVAQNESRAQQLGFNVRLRRFVIFTLGAALAGLGGAFYALLLGHVTTAVFDLGLSVNAILWAVLGGLGTAFGPLIGVLVIYPLTELIASVFVYVQIVIGLLLVAVAVFFPKGIIGSVMEAVPSTRVPPRTRVGLALGSDE